MSEHLTPVIRYMRKNTEGIDKYIYIYILGISAQNYHIFKFFHIEGQGQYGKEK